jgi:hypothetical protein
MNLVFIKVICIVLSITMMPSLARAQSIPCPKNCVCSANQSKLRLKCGGTSTNKIVSIKELDFGEIEADVEQL